MLKILDKYILKEIIPTLVLWYLSFTFLLVTFVLVKRLYIFINTGLSLSNLVRFVAYSVPFQSVLTIPMSVLLAILMAFGRFSGDGEIIAMKAGGISLFRMLKPVWLFSIIPYFICTYLYVELAPASGQAIRELYINMQRSNVDTESKPLTFQQFGEFTIYMEKISKDRTNLFNVFCYSNKGEIITARRAQKIYNPADNSLNLRLLDGEIHLMPKKDTKEYHVNKFQLLEYDMSEMLESRMDIRKNYKTMSFSELRKAIDERLNKDDKSDIAYMLVEFHKRFAIPMACLIFPFLGVALGISNRRGGKASGVAVSVGIFTLYYMFLAFGRGVGDKGILSPFVAIWLPNLVTGAIGVVVFTIMHFEKTPTFIERTWDRLAIVASSAWQFITRRSQFDSDQAFRTEGRLTKRSYTNFSITRVLDRYVLREFLKFYFGVLMILVVIIFLVHLFEKIDTMLEEKAALNLAAQYFIFKTTGFAFFAIPFGALVATFLCFGNLSRSQEIVAMKAAGLSVWRIVGPVIMVGLIIGVLTYGFNDYVLPVATRRADEIMDTIKGKIPKSKRISVHKWFKGEQGQIFHYLIYIPQEQKVGDFSLMEFYPGMRLKYRLEAKSLLWQDNGWIAKQAREIRFNPEGEVVMDDFRDQIPCNIIEKPQDFAQERKEAEEMSYQELREHIRFIRNSGYSATELEVDLYAKISLSFICAVMIILAIPFSITPPRQSSALKGIGIAILIGACYYFSARIFIELGHGGKLPPFLAAWLANVIFLSLGLWRLFRMET